MAIDTRKQRSKGRGLYQPGVQARVSAALSLAAERLAKLGDPRILTADADLSDMEQEEGRITVLVRAHMTPGLEVYELEKKLADEVFVQVFQETRVLMSILTLRPNQDARTEMVHPDGLLFPLIGR
jgi:hypothetical protein